MIQRVRVKNFKRFEEQEFELANHVLLAGPNNSGKTTLLQAILTWNFALQRWRERRGPDSRSNAKLRTGVPITGQEFSAVPIREAGLLWHDTRTALKKEELEIGQKPGQPRVLSIELMGETDGRPWQLGFEFRYSNSELFYAKPNPDHLADLEIVRNDVNVVHVPPFSGIGSVEPRHDEPYQALLIGQGKAGEILRNLLFELYGPPEQGDRSAWNELNGHIGTIFGYHLLPPKYNGTPYIVCEYLPGRPQKGTGGLPALDISSAGSGFLQVLLLLAFFYARPSTVLLLDEPDAHLHIILQKQIHDLLLRVARERKCQLIVATHSEVLIDGMEPRRILSFYGPPHLLVSEREREQVREAIRVIPAMDILLAEQTAGVLYVEGESDFNLLKAWSEILDHPLRAWFVRSPFWRSNQGRNPRDARHHLFALRALRREFQGVLLLDGDNRQLQEQEVAADGLVVLRWRRYEAENYLINVQLLERFVLQESTELQAAAAVAWLRNELPPVVVDNPLEDHEFLAATPASKNLLPRLFSHLGLDVPKPEYFRIIHCMQADEVPPEVVEKMDGISAVLRGGNSLMRSDPSV